MIPNFSLVTPCYNSYHLMERFFESLVNQTYKNFELIVVDDCSSDDSYNKLLEYSKNSVLNLSIQKTPKNSGPGCAKNLGMEVAKGKWITFLDSDDWVSLDFIEKVNAALENNSADSLVYNYCTTNDNSSKVAVQSSVYGVNQSGYIDLEAAIFRVRDHSIGKFYLLSKLNEKGIRYPEDLRRCEDIAFVARALDACGSVYFLNESFYYYLQRTTSLSNNKNMGDVDCKKAFAIIENELSIKYPRAIKEKSVPVLLYGVLLMKCKGKASKNEICEYLNSYEEKYPDWQNCDIIGSLGKTKGLFLKAAKSRNIWMLRLLTYIHTKLVG